MCACVVCACGVLELIKQSGASVSGVFGKRVCVLVCFVLWHAVGCLEQHECCSIESPLFW